MPGPPPKRTSQRRRRNKTDPVTTAAVDGDQRGPDLTGAHSAAAKRFWAALRTSGQSQFFEPSDWAAAELVVIAIDTFVKTPTAAMLSAIQTGMSSLLITEGDRRRLRVELERPKPEEGEGSVTWLADARRRVGGAG